eukprot:COSAG01_NODE_18236_length_1090_cov_5.292634_1_plen_176_part_00
MRCQTYGRHATKNTCKCRPPHGRQFACWGCSRSHALNQLALLLELRQLLQAAAPVFGERRLRHIGSPSRTLSALLVPHPASTGAVSAPAGRGWFAVKSAEHRGRRRSRQAARSSSDAAAAASYSSGCMSQDPQAAAAGSYTRWLSPCSTHMTAPGSGHTRTRACGLAGSISRQQN